MGSAYPIIRLWSDRFFQSRPQRARRASCDRQEVRKRESDHTKVRADGGLDDGPIGGDTPSVVCPAGVCAPGVAAVCPAGPCSATKESGLYSSFPLRRVT